MGLNIYIVHKQDLDTYVALKLCIITKDFDVKQLIKNQAPLFNITFSFPFLTSSTLTSSWKMEYFITLNGLEYEKRHIKKNHLYTILSIYLFGKLQKKV